MDELLLQCLAWPEVLSKQGRAYRRLLVTQEDGRATSLGLCFGKIPILKANYFQNPVQ